MAQKDSDITAKIKAELAEKRKKDPIGYKKTKPVVKKGEKK